MIFFVRYLSLLFLFDNGNFMILFFISSDNGVNGNIYDLPNVFMLHIFVVNIMNTINIPNIPNIVIIIYLAMLLKTIYFAKKAVPQ